ncbi:MAG TPA: translocation/assembly module TamB domain-containing protein [bacterium]|jgi:hypothetical protein
MRRVLRYLLIGVLSIIGLVVLVVVLALTSPVQTYVAKRVLISVNRNLTGKLAFKSVRVTINGDVTLEGLQVMDSTGQILVSLNKLDLSVNPLALRRNRIFVRHLEMDGLAAALEFDSTGTNVQRALAPRNPSPKSAPATAKPAPWRIRVADASIEGLKTSISKGDTLLFQTDAWSLKGEARYVNDSLKYVLGLQVPQRLDLNTDGTLFLGNPFMPLIGHLSLIADTGIVALFPLPASTVGAVNLTLSFVSSMDSIKLNADMRGSKFGHVTVHGAGVYPLKSLAMRGEMTFDSLTPGAMWSDTTGMMLFGNLQFSKQSAVSPLEGWNAAVNLKSSRYGRYRLATANLKVRTHDSTITLSGELDTGDGRAEITSVIHGFLPADPTVQTTIRLEALNLHKLLPQIPDSLLPITGIIEAHGNYVDPQHVDADLNTALGPITLGSYTVDSLILRGTLRGGKTIRIDTLRIQRDAVRLGLSASGEIGGDLQYAVAGVIPDLHAARRLLPKSMNLSDTLGGSLSFEVTGSASLAKQRLSRLTAAGNLRLDSAVYGADTVQHLTAHIDRFDMDSMAVHGNVAVRGLKAAGQAADSIYLAVNGSPDSLSAGVNLWAKADTIQLAGAFRLRRTPARMDLAIDSLSGKYADLTFATEGENSVTLAGKRLDVNGLTITSNVGVLRAAGTLQRGGKEDFTLELSGLRTERLAKLFKLPETKSVSNLRVQIIGPDNDLTGDINLIADSVAMNGQPLADEFTLHAVVDARHAVVDGQMNWLGDTTLIFNVELPARFAIDKGLIVSRNETITGRLQLLEQRLDKFNRYLSKSMQLGGLISADMALKGTMAKPEWEGTFAIQKGTYRDDRQGIRYKDITINGSLDGDSLRLPEFNATAGGKLTGSGWAVMALPLPSVLHLDLDADRFQAVNNPNMRARLSGKMTVDGPLNRLDMHGNLRLDEALYRLTASSTKQVEPIDVRAEIANLGGDTTHQNMLPSTIYRSMSHSLTLYIPGNAWVRGQGMNVALSGNLQVDKSRGDPMPILAGEIDVERGTVSFYGHQFQVEGDQQSFIRFEGPPDDPAIDITATDPRLAENNVDITVRVFGTLKKMRLSLAGTSGAGGQDTLSAAQIASLLSGVNLTGREIAGAPRDTTSNAQKVESAATGAATGSLAGLIGGAAGLDVLAFRPGGTGGVNGLTSGSLEVGTYLTERLFIQVVQPIQAINVGSQEVSVEYRLFRWLNLRAQQIGAGESAFDLLMRVDWR